MIDDSFATRLSAAIAASGISQGELERRACLSKGYVSRLLSGKKGRRTSVRIVMSIATALSVDPESLLPWKEAPIPSSRRTAATDDPNHDCEPNSFNAESLHPVAIQATVAPSRSSQVNEYAPSMRSRLTKLEYLLDLSIRNVDRERNPEQAKLLKEARNLVLDAMKLEGE